MDMSGSLETRKQKKARSAGRGEAGRLPRAGARNAGVGRSDRFGLFGGLGFAGLALAPARFLLIAAETMLGRGFAKTFLRRSGLGGLAWQRRKRVIGLRSHFGCEIPAAGRARLPEIEGSSFLAERRDPHRGCKAGITAIAGQKGISCPA